MFNSLDAQNTQQVGSNTSLQSRRYSISFSLVFHIFYFYIYLTPSYNTCTEAKQLTALF